MNRLRFGTYLAPNVMPVYELVTREVGRRLGIETEAVANGEIDGSTIDSQVLEIALRDDPHLAANLRVVEALGPSTIQPVAVSRRVPTDPREAISDVLVTMAEDPLVRERLAVGLVERFTPVDASAYDDIRMMLDACDQAGFMELR